MPLSDAGGRIEADLSIRTKQQSGKIVGSFIDAKRAPVVSINMKIEILDAARRASRDQDACTPRNMHEPVDSIACCACGKRQDLQRSSTSAPGSPCHILEQTVSSFRIRSGLCFGPGKWAS